MSARATWTAYVVLLALSIPWYFPQGTGEPLVFGFPIWCLVSLACYTAAALLTVLRLDAVWQAQEAAVRERLGDITQSEAGE